MAQDKLLDVEIVTPQRVLYTGKAISVTVPGTKSPFQVLFNHAPIVSTLELGMVRIVDEKEKKLLFATSPGFTEVRKNKVSILVEHADNAENLVPDDIASELEDARKVLNETEDPEQKAIARKNFLAVENKQLTLKKLKDLN